MYLENGKISERQCFRIGVLENIALGILVIPYITSNVAGKWHFTALLLGLFFTFLYSLAVYFLSREFSQGLIVYIGESFGITGKLILGLYFLRYIIRGGLIIIFFGGIIQEYMLRSFNMTWIIIPFVVICCYGAGNDLEKRGRLMELLFWWMLVPIILVGVFSISNLDWKAVPLMFSTLSMRGLGGEASNVLLGGYLVLVCLSSLELMMFTLTGQKKNSWENALKTILWVMIAVFMSHIFIVAILGREWTGVSSTSVFSVMEATSLGGTVERMDYPVLTFWIIGVFATVSGYMYYSKELVNVISGKKRNWSVALIGLLFALSTYIWRITDVAKVLTWYTVWVDIWIGLLIPVVFLFIRKFRKKAFIKGTVPVLAIVALCGLTGCKSIGNTVELTREINTDFSSLDQKNVSLENRDYVVSLTVAENTEDDGEGSREDEELRTEDNGQKKLYFKFAVADLEEYKGASQGTLKEKSYEYFALSLKESLLLYSAESKRQLDMGHVWEIKLFLDYGSVEMEQLIKELESMPSVPKSVTVMDSDGNELPLRDVIKIVYSGVES